MLEDRDYMRQPEFEERWRPNFRLRWSWTTVLLAAYVAVFLTGLMVQHFFPDNNFFHGHHRISNGEVGELLPGYLPLSAQGLVKGYVWQLITYQFLHAGFLHLLLNCWAIYVFGRELEHLLGGRRYLALMFSSGIVGGIFQVLTALIWPGLFGGEIIGASACAFGLVAAFALIFPERELTMLIFFVIPVRLRAKTLLIFSAVLAVMGIIFPWDNVANAAHIGGMAMGCFYVKKLLKNPAMIGAAADREFLPPPKAGKKSAQPEEKSADEFLESEVDPILDKISAAHGTHSLTARERAILEAASKKIARR